VSVLTEIRIGSDFVGYRIDELIGRGGMGVVYRAYDLRLKRMVALKLMSRELALDERFRERFSREAELAMSLEHPNVVPVHDAGDIDGRLYLAMRYVEGTDLRALLHVEGALEPARAVAICSEVANALDAAHANGLVHRDVKPSNVLLDTNEHVYLADFGLTRRLADEAGPMGEGRSMGTPAYLAPEQIEGGPVDGRVDVYSLGCLLYECLTGGAPFAGSRLAVAWSHLEDDPPKASERRPDLPEAIDAVIRKSMSKEPQDRQSTCAALIAAAEEALRLRRPATRRRHRLLIGAAVATLVGLAAALVATLVFRGLSDSALAVPVDKVNTLVRIDPGTNQVGGTVGVGSIPSATAVAGGSVWVYNAGDPSLSQIDAATGAVRHTTPLLAVPRNSGVFGGPVLAADKAGAWFIGLDATGRSFLTRVFSWPRGKREFPLGEEPRAVAVGYGAVWVVTRGARDDELVRLDPAGGSIIRKRFPTSSRIDALAAGLGSVWVGSSSTATLYRIDPRSRRVTGSLDLGERAARPEVVLGSIWVGLADSGGDTVIVRPWGKLGRPEHLGCCPPDQGYDTAGYGSIWTYDNESGNVVRWNGETHQPAHDIRITNPPIYSCLALTSIAAGDGAVWVTVAANENLGC
jgi:serine/threonine-protein kinase